MRHRTRLIPARQSRHTCAFERASSEILHVRPQCFRMVANTAHEPGRARTCRCAYFAVRLVGRTGLPANSAQGLARESSVPCAWLRGTRSNANQSTTHRSDSLLRVVSPQQLCAARRRRSISLRDPRSHEERTGQRASDGHDRVTRERALVSGAVWLRPARDQQCFVPTLPRSARPRRAIKLSDVGARSRCSSPTSDVGCDPTPDGLIASRARAARGVPQPASTRGRRRSVISIPAGSRSRKGRRMAPAAGATRSPAESARGRDADDKPHRPHQGQRHSLTSRA